MEIQNKTITEKVQKNSKVVAITAEGSMIMAFFFFCVEGRQLLKVLEQLSSDLVFEMGIDRHMTMIHIGCIGIAASSGVYFKGLRRCYETCGKVSW
jgi:hypothetical protein